MMITDIKYKGNVRNITPFCCDQGLNTPFEELSKKINIDELDLKFYPIWYLIDGEYYFYKQKLAFNEMFVSELFRELGLPTPQIIPAFKNDFGYDEYGIISKNIRKQGYNYEYYSDLMYRIMGLEKFNDAKYHNLFETRDAICNKLPNGQQLYDDLSSLLAADFFVGQADRTSCNTLIEIDKKGNASLAPITDNGFAFSSVVSTIYSVLGAHFYAVKGTSQTLSDLTLFLLLNNKAYRTTIEKCLGINVNQILRRTLRKYEIEISKTEQKEVIDYLSTQQEIIDYTLSLVRRG